MIRIKEDNHHFEEFFYHRYLSLVFFQFKFNLSQESFFSLVYIFEHPKQFSKDVDDSAYLHYPEDSD